MDRDGQNVEIRDNPTTASGSMDSYADFLQGLLDSLEPPVGVAGFPMGGYVALALMRRRRSPARPDPSPDGEASGSL